ncbi:MAG: carbamoyltransferase HypF [Actinomycetota bacterium]
MVDQRIRTRLRVTGTVQGVGFRPFVYGLAARLGLSGFVLNDAAGVLIEVEGRARDVEAFRAILASDPPPLAVVESVTEERVANRGDGSFEIRASAGGGRRLAAVSPDFAPCDDCIAEIVDPHQRRFGYGFTNCTNCGPRFTVTTDIPYDRPNTTMAVFDMCSECRTEFEDPVDRRFHAQPIACARCGPHLSVSEGDGRPLAGDPIRTTARLLARGSILAIKGLGGFHLACDATNETAVAELRRRKNREEKPLAVMVADLAGALELVDLSDEEREVLTSQRRPIVLARRKPNEGVAESVAPGNAYLGIMLPYTPLHHLLMAEVSGPIVLTSGNLSDEPIAYQDSDARDRLSGLVEAWLTHNRPIHVRCDDSVVRSASGFTFPLRRARGYAPEPLHVALPFERRVLAAGPELKHTFCLGSGERAILSHHIGNLETYAAMSSFIEGVEHFTRIFDISPEVVAYDLHPEYMASKWALAQPDVGLVGVQHHHAHIVSCMTDNLRTEPVIGLALDGTGYGEDGAIWGCEVLVSRLATFERVAHLRYVPMPGGAMAIREPWRMAAVYLDAAFGDDAESLPIDFVSRTSRRWGPILQMAATGLNAPVTSSAGRMFDAVAALCGLRDRVSYEGQAAAELEQVADGSVLEPYPCTVARGLIDGVELVGAVARDLASGSTVGEVAARFHNGLADALVRACVDAGRQYGLGTAALSGGSFQNVLLLERVAAGLEPAGFEVLAHRRVPPNDGGISLGQAVVANARMRVEDR